MTLKEKVEEAKDRVSQWYDDNKGNIIYGCYVAACIGAVVAPIVRRSRRQRIEYRRERMIYDPSLGFYWETKRNLTNNQKLMIENRHRMGEPYGEILRDMKLLRK